MAQWFFKITAYADALLDDLDDDRLAGAHEEDPERPHRPLRGRRGAVPRRGARPSTSRSSRPGPTRCSGRRSSWSRPSPRWSTCWSSGRATTRCASYARIAAARPTEERSDARKDGRLHRPVRDQPGERRADPDLGRRLRADGVRHRRDHGRACARRARPRVRRDVRPADRARDRRRRQADRFRRVRRAAVAARRSTRSSPGWTSAGTGKPAINYRLRDWSFSRQRYWGCPIPIVYCEQDGIVAVPEDRAAGAAARRHRLPAEGQAAARLEPGLHQHRRARSAAGRRSARPTRWTRSSTRPGTSCATPIRTTHEAPFDREIVDYWMPIDQYVGGIDHVKGHLLYSRFFVEGAERHRPGRVPRAVPAPLAPGLGEAGRLEDVEVAGQRLGPGRADRAVRRGRDSPLHPLPRPGRPGHGLDARRRRGDAAVRQAAVARRAGGRRPAGVARRRRYAACPQGARDDRPVSPTTSAAGSSSTRRSRP